MKLAISNIAWSNNEDEEINSILDDLSIEAVEVAPTKIWINPVEQSRGNIVSYRNYWNEKKRKIVALQSLLFGRTDLTLFENKQKREETYQYLSKIIELGAILGAKVFVFGSPKNRIVGDIPLTQALNIAIPFFAGLGKVAAKCGSTFCIEPNPEVYGCDFIRNTEEGLALVKEVGHPGFGLHLDAAAITINEENIEESLNNAFPFIFHFHISEPYLQKVQEGMVDHQTIAKQLKQLNYERYISIEMREGLTDSNSKTVRDSLSFVQNVYFG